MATYRHKVAGGAEDHTAQAHTSVDYNRLMGNDRVHFGEMPPGQFLLGLMSAFDNRYQAFADLAFGEITWKQAFAIICVKLCNGCPTINELAEVMGSSHQNVKQILLKLEKKGFVRLVVDEEDRRKQRIIITESCKEFCEAGDDMSTRLIGQLFEGITDEEVIGTIGVISRMEKNLRRLRV